MSDTRRRLARLFDVQKMTRPTVLIADDDRGLVEALSIRLNAAGYHVVSCMDGDDVVEQVRGDRPDVMVLDINMPAGTGPEAQKALEAFREGDRVPVIYISGESAEAIRRVQAQMKPSAILRKPFDAEELIAVIRAVLGG